MQNFKSSHFQKNFCCLLNTVLFIFKLFFVFHFKIYFSIRNFYQDLAVPNFEIFNQRKLLTFTFHSGKIISHNTEEKEKSTICYAQLKHTCSALENFISAVYFWWYWEFYIFKSNKLPPFKKQTRSDHHLGSFLASLSRLKKVCLSLYSWNYFKYNQWKFFLSICEI